LDASRIGIGLLAASFLSMPLVGCAKPTTETAEEHGHSHGDSHGHSHTHGEVMRISRSTTQSWWCAEHGVPEEECGRCDSKLAAAFQREADWCQKHNRPDSQCFICNPELEAKFAARYEAKYGKSPLKPEVN
jgi:hypothetical protein